MNIVAVGIGYGFKLTSKMEETVKINGDAEEQLCFVNCKAAVSEPKQREVVVGGQSRSGGLSE